MAQRHSQLRLGASGRSTGMVGEAWTTWGQKFHDVLADEPLRAAASEAAGRDVALAELRFTDDPAVSAVLDRAATALGKLVVLIHFFITNNSFLYKKLQAHLRMFLYIYYSYLIQYDTLYQ